MVKTLVMPPFKPGDEKNFTDIAGAEVFYSAAPTDEQLASAEVIIGTPKPDVLRKATSLKFLQITNAGADVYVANPDAFAKGAVLANLSGAFGQSISEFVLAMVLNLYKHMHLFRDSQNLCRWQDEGVQYSPVGKKLLIMGAGDIGTAVAKLFRAFNCHITGMRRTTGELPAEYDAMITPDSLDEALADADIVVAALPGTKDTYKMLDERRLKLLKKEALLINVGRGSLIDCDALAAILNENGIYGAALDVTDPEPLPPTHPLWKCKNCIITPHATGGSFGHLKATEEKLVDICRVNLSRYIKGEPVLNIVDFSTGYRVTEHRY